MGLVQKDRDYNFDEALTAYQEAQREQQALVRELDILLNGEEGAAKQASLCDIVNQVRGMRANKILSDNIKPTLYYRTPKTVHDYKGDRYFKVVPGRDHVVQVCIYAGEPKRGRGATIGISIIGRITFHSNYLAISSYLEICTEQDYKQAFDKTLELLS